MINQIRLGARLRAARKAAGFKTSKELSKKHKVPESTYSQHESGARQPNDETLKFYSKTFGVNFSWLKSGEGQPYSLISKSKNSIFKEELIDLVSIKPTTKYIDHNLLKNILSELFDSIQLDVPKRMTKKLATKAAKTYNLMQSKRKL